MKVKKVIEMLEKQDPEASIFFALDPDLKEGGYRIVEVVSLGKTQVMALLKKNE